MLTCRAQLSLYSVFRVPLLLTALCCLILWNPSWSHCCGKQNDKKSTFLHQSSSPFVYCVWAHRSWHTCLHWLFWACRSEFLNSISKSVHCALFDFSDQDFRFWLSSEAEYETHTEFPGFGPTEKEKGGKKITNASDLSYFECVSCKCFVQYVKLISPQYWHLHTWMPIRK